MSVVLSWCASPLSFGGRTSANSSSHENSDIESAKRSTVLGCGAHDPSLALANSLDRCGWWHLLPCLGGRHRSTVGADAS